MNPFGRMAAAMERMAAAQERQSEAVVRNCALGNLLLDERREQESQMAASRLRLEALQIEEMEFRKNPIRTLFEPPPVSSSTVTYTEPTYGEEHPT